MPQPTGHDAVHERWREDGRTRGRTISRTESPAGPLRHPLGRELRATDEELEFLRDRRRWWAVEVLPGYGEQYGGYSVVLKIDGIYESREDAEAMADFYARELRKRR